MKTTNELELFHEMSVCSQRRATAPRTAVITTPNVPMLIFEPVEGAVVVVAVLQEELYTERKEGEGKKIRPKNFDYTDIYIPLISAVALP